MQNLQEQWIKQLSAMLEAMSGAVFTASPVLPASHPAALVWADLEVEMEATDPSEARMRGRAALSRSSGRLSIGAPEFVVTQAAQLARGEPLDPGVELTPEHLAEWKRLLEQSAEELTGVLRGNPGLAARVTLLRVGDRTELRAGPELNMPERGLVEGEDRSAWVIQGGNAELHLELAGGFSSAQGETLPGRRSSDTLRETTASDSVGSAPRGAPPAPPVEPAGAASRTGSSRLDLLLDVELEATLRFGSRELPLREVLELGPGDVVQLDRHVHEPVDLIVGDKIVARGEVVLVNGNFGLRVTQVAEPKSRLESVRCLF